MSVLTDLATLLQAAGVGTYDATGNTSTIFVHSRPDAPASLISIEVYGAAPPGPLLFDSTVPEWENPRLQVVARDPDGDACYAKAYAAYQSLIGLSDISVGSVHYYAIRSVTPPVSQGRDENNNQLYGFNLQVQRTIG